MANKGKLVFPIMFDLEAGVNDAIKDWDKRSKILEKAVTKKSINVPISLNIKNLNTLDDVKKRLAGLRIQPIDKANAAAIKDLIQQLKALARAMEKVQRFKGIELPELQRAKAAKYQMEVAQANEKLRLAQERVRQAEARLILSQQRAEQQAHSTSQAYSAQAGTLSGLTKMMAAYGSMSLIRDQLTKVREVTAEFELQKVSLGAILQDQAKANQLFSEIKSFALKSPVSILDLTKYTKQLAAYKIGYDELFETTKRLTDVSVGLGVSMDRVVLAYGQVRATGHLRASEIRQFTEMGVPIVEELAAKLSKMNGELVTAADVMDLVSKRGISFQMVKEVFDDMTSAGGIFYNMQEKQGNTLYGLWAKLGDAASMMYDQIGNTGPVNSGMKLFIQTLRSLMLNWKQVGVVVGGVTALMAANAIVQKNAAIATASASAATAKHVASLKAEEVALVRKVALSKENSIVTGLMARASLASTRAQIQAATATNVFSKTLYGLKAAIMSNPIGLIAVALTTVIGLFATASDKVVELQKDLSGIDNDYNRKGKELTDNFARLADAATSSVDGSKQQKDALDELNRTYGDILGSQNLELERLTALNGKYGELNDMIRAHNELKRGEAKKSAIESNFSERIAEAKDKVTDYLTTYGATDNEISAFWANVEADMADGVDSVTALMNRLQEVTHSNGAAFKNFINIFDPSKLVDTWQNGLREIGNGFNAQFIFDFAHLIDERNRMLDENEQKTREAADALGVYSTSLGNLNTAIKTLDWGSMQTLSESLAKYNEQHPEAQIAIPIDFAYDPGKAETQYERALETANMQIASIFENLKQIAREEGVEIPSEFYVKAKSVVEDNKDFSFVAWDSLMALPFSDKAKAAIKASKELVEAIAPSDATVRVVNRRFVELADAMGVSLDNMQRYLMKSGDTLEEHRKKLSETITDILKDIARLQFTKKLLDVFGMPTEAVDEEISKYQKEVEFLQKMLAEVPDLAAIGKMDKGSKQADTRLQTLKEIESILTSINSKYEELRKKEGDVKALADINMIYNKQLESINSAAKKFGLAFEMPTDFKSLQEYRDSILKVIEGLKKSGLKGADKAALELEMKIGEGNVSELQKDLEAHLKSLSEKIGQTKIAKEFYDKILTETGNVNLAAKVSASIYGTTGDELYEDMVKYIRKIFKSGKNDIEIDLAPVFDATNQRIDYNALAEIYRKYKNDLIKDNKESAKEIVEEGKKTVASNILTWQKELAKAKSFEEQRTDILNREVQRRAAIIREVNDPELRGLYLSQSYERQAQELSKLSIDEFKSSDDYIKVFQDLDRVSEETLDRVKKRLEEMIAQVKDTENVEGLKALVAQLDKINQEKESRNPMQAVIDGFKEYTKARKDYRTAEAEEATARAEFAQQEISLNKEIAEAKAQQEAAQKRVNDLQSQGKIETSEGITAQLELNDATKRVVKATEKHRKAEKKVTDAAQKTTDALDNQKAALDKMAEGISAMANGFDSAASSIQTIAEMMGIAEDSELGDIVNGLVSGLQNASTILTTILSISLAIESACWWMVAIGGAVAAFTAIGSWLTGSKVRKANKEIEKQKGLLDQLEYTYNRLQKASDKLFGSDYIANFKQQKRNLEAQQEAYLKMAEAEKKKGKKTDQAKVDEYLKNARDIADTIADMEGQLAEHFLGSDLASTAREFANAWLDAYLAFGNTADAISEKFHDMIKNMIVESVLAQIVQRSLKPLFDEIDKRAEDGELSANDIVEVMSKVPQLIDQIDNGLTVGMKSLESLGLDVSSMRDGENEYTGIAKNVAGATSEEINANTAALNTQNYYMSGIPAIASNVALIAQRMLLETQPTATTTEGIDFATYHANSLAQFESLNNYAAQILTECQRSVAAAEKSAKAAQETADQLRKVVIYKGGSAGIVAYLKQ